MLTDVDVVNGCLATLSQAPVDVLIQQRVTNSALTALARQNKRLQSRGWWFNTTKVTVTPGAGNVVSGQLPTDPLSIVGPLGESLLLQEDDTLFNTTTGTVVSTPTLVTVTREVPFAEVHPLANQAIYDAAVLEFQKNFAPNPELTTKLEQQLQASADVLAEENLRVILAGNFYMSAGFR